MSDERVCGECWKVFDSSCFNQTRFACDECSKKLPPPEKRHLYSKGLVHKINLEDEMLKQSEASRPAIMCLKCVVVQKELETQTQRIEELEEEIHRLRNIIAVQKTKKKESLSGYLDRLHDGSYFVSDSRSMIVKANTFTDVEDLPTEYLPRWILKRLMGLRSFGPLTCSEHSMQWEFEYYGNDEDRENWKYTMNEVAGSRKDGRDKGHEGWRLDDFWAQPPSTGAALTKMEVAALRLYSGSSNNSINRALREGSKQFETTIYTITVAIQKLQMWQNRSWNNLFRGLRGLDSNLDRIKGEGWMDMGDLPLLYDLPTLFECGFFSVSQQQIESSSSDPLLIGRLCTAQSIGASVSWVSQYPEDEEVLFSPGVMLVANPKCYRVANRSASTQKGRITYNLELPIGSRELEFWVIQPTCCDLQNIQPPLLHTPEDLCNY